jgi:nucleotide-binding universal stress UspA family protein
MIKHVLIPTDFSANAKNAIIYAIGLAKMMNFELIFLHCTQTLVPTGKKKEAAEEGLNRYKTEIEEKLTAHVAAITDSENFDTNLYKCFVVDAENIVDGINEVVKHHKIDMVIMGTQGASGLKKFLVGSTTANLIEKTDVPLLAIPENYVFKTIKKIGYASDLINIDGEIQEAIKITRFFDASIDIFHIYPVYPKVVSIAQTNSDELVAQLQKLYHYPKINFHFVHTSSDNEIKKGVDLYVEAYKPDLLLMFTHKRDFIDKIFDKSQTKEVASSAQVPLLALRYE